MLVRLAEAVAFKNTALVCFDFPAHGESPQGDEFLTVENCIADLLYAADWTRLNYPSAEKYIFATSFGGYVSLLCHDGLSEFNYFLRVPAVTMPKVLMNAVLKCSVREFRQRGVAECGFERKIMLRYEFYEDLLRYDPMACGYARPMIVFHGDNDDVVPYKDVYEFCAKHENTKLITIKGADHRFKNPGEIEQIIDEVKRYIIL